MHPMAPEHLPRFIALADGSDYLLNVMAVFTIGLILLIGIFYLTLHAMPERMAHEGNHSQLQVVGILALLALFTHNNAFWIIAILVAAFRMPDFMTPISSIAASLSTLARRDGSLDVAPDLAPPDDRADKATPPEPAAEGAH